MMKLLFAQSIHIIDVERWFRSNSRISSIYPNYNKLQQITTNHENMNMKNIILAGICKIRIWIPIEAIFFA